MSFPWKKDEKLLAEAKELEDSLYENQVIFMFGYQLGTVKTEYAIKHLHLLFRSPNQFSDAILFRDDTNEVLNIEFEMESKNFEEHRHDAKKCDLIVCFFHDKSWKNPIPVYEVVTGKLYPSKKES